jgi:hypothetical protein
MLSIISIMMVTFISAILLLSFIKGLVRFHWTINLDVFSLGIFIFYGNAK